MDASDEQLAQELKGLLSQTGMRTAFGDEPQEAEGDKADEQAFDAFFEAMRAFRAARSSGDPVAEAQAEERLRQVVRGELQGERLERDTPLRVSAVWG